MSTNHEPCVVKESSRGMEFIDIPSYDFNNNSRIYLLGDITEDVVNSTLMQFSRLQSKGEPISIIINSAGGSVLDGMVLVDIIEKSTVPVDVTVAGKAMSMAAIILAAAGKGHRHALKSSQILIHEPRIGINGIITATELAIKSDSLMKVRDKTSEVLARHTGHSLDEINDLIKGEDVLFTASEAVDFGIVDNIVDCI